MSAIFGFGSVIINQIVFTNGEGVLWYEQEPVYDEQKDNGQLIRKTKLRAYATVKLPNFDATDETHIRSLIQNLNYYRDSGLYVQPREYDEILMLWTNPFKPEDISNLNKGQILTLEFKAVNPADNIPATFYQQSSSYLSTELSENIITEDGNKIILEG